MKLKRQDAFVLIGLQAVGLLLAIGLLLTRQNGAQVIVRVAGEETASFPLDQAITDTIQGANGGTNVLKIADGAAWLEDASCPDRLCVHDGKIRYTGESILCLPNQVVVTIEGNEAEDRVDLVAR